MNATVVVSADPQTAFRIFTEEIDSWWERGPHNFYDARRAVAILAVTLTVALLPGRAGGLYLAEKGRAQAKVVAERIAASGDP